MLYARSGGIEDPWVESLKRLKRDNEQVTPNQPEKRQDGIIRGSCAME